MALKITHADGVTVIGLPGDLDMEEAVHVKNIITAVVAEGCAHIVLDFTRVQHLNTTSIGILADRLHFVRGYAGDLKLSGVNPFLQHIFELTGVKKVFPMYSTPDEAAESFRKIMAAA